MWPGSNCPLDQPELSKLHQSLTAYHGFSLTEFHTIQSLDAHFDVRPQDDKISVLRQNVLANNYEPAFTTVYSLHGKVY